MNDKMIARLDAKGKRYTINFGEGLYLRINPTVSTLTAVKSIHYRSHLITSSKRNT